MKTMIQDIEFEIEHGEFRMENPRRKITFDMTLPLALKMYEHFRALVVPPFIQNPGLIEKINEKTFTLDFVMGSNDFWLMDLKFGSEGFHAEMRREEIFGALKVLQKCIEG